MHNILIIDDDVELCELLAEYLTAEGFKITFVNLGDAGLEKLHQHPFDLVILDVMLPETNGFDILREIRQFSTTPVVMLTARGDDVDKIVGLEIGADDYLPKPFNPRELVVRLKAILRRSHNLSEEEQPPVKQLNIDDIAIDLEKRTVTINNSPIVLTNTEYNILVHLMLSVNKAITKEILYKKVLRRKMTSFDRSLDVHVSNLRNKLGPNKQGKPRIKTIHGYGYIYESRDA